MLTVAGTTRVFVATTPVDLRGSFNRLYSLVVEHLKGDPLSGSLLSSLFLYYHRESLVITELALNLDKEYGVIFHQLKR